MAQKNAMTVVKQVESLILVVRGQKVMLDADLAALYGVETKARNRAVKRNQFRFPQDFLFQLTAAEAAALRCQNGTSKTRGGRRYLPYVFTEHGAIMAATVLNSERAVQASVWVVRAFVRLREALAANRELAQKLKELEGRVDGHDSDIRSLVSAIRQLMSPPPVPSRRIGFSRERD